MIGATGGAAEDLAAEMLAVGLFKGQAPEGLGDAAAKVVSSGDFTGKEGETALLYGQDGLGAARLLLVGLGSRERFDLERLRLASATAAKRARTLKLRDAAFSLPLVRGAGVREAAQAAAEGASLGLYHFDRHKSGAGASRARDFPTRLGREGPRADHRGRRGRPEGRLGSLSRPGLGQRALQRRHPRVPRAEGA